MFRAASDDDIEAYSDSVTCFIRKCIEEVVPKKTIRIYPNQKPWINSDVRSALSAAFKSGNNDNRKQANYDLRKSIKAAKRQYKTKLKNNSTPTMQEACGSASTTSQVLKGTYQLLWTLPLLYRREFCTGPSHDSWLTRLSYIRPALSELRVVHHCVNSGAGEDKNVSD